MFPRWQVNYPAGWIVEATKWTENISLTTILCDDPKDPPDCRTASHQVSDISGSYKPNLQLYSIYYARGRAMNSISHCIITHSTIFDRFTISRPSPYTQPSLKRKNKLKYICRIDSIYIHILYTYIYLTNKSSWKHI